MPLAALFTPPVQTGAAPTLEAEIQAPEAAESPEVYGDAQWVKIFKTELKREVTLDEWARLLATGLAKRARDSAEASAALRRLLGQA